MSETKNEILKSALRLFNEMGVSQVSLRIIAADMGISLGNLTYHFKKREEIIEALYLELVSRLDETITKKLNTKSQFDLLFEIPRATISNFYEYRFLMLDFVDITRNHAMIQDHYHKLMIERELQFEKLVSDLIAAKLLREENRVNEYSFLFKNLRIVGDFWLSAKTIDKNGVIDQKDLQEGSQLLEFIIFPFLTSEGQSKFLDLKR